MRNRIRPVRAQWREICVRGRVLREVAGTLAGHAAGDHRRHAIDPASVGPWAMATTAGEPRLIKEKWNLRAARVNDESAKRALISITRLETFCWYGGIPTDAISAGTTRNDAFRRRNAPPLPFRSSTPPHRPDQDHWTTPEVSVLRGNLTSACGATSSARSTRSGGKPCPRADRRSHVVHACPMVRVDYYNAPNTNSLVLSVTAALHDDQGRVLVREHPGLSRGDPVGRMAARRTQPPAVDPRPCVVAATSQFIELSRHRLVARSSING